MTRSQLNTITRLARAGALEQAWALFNAGFRAGFGAGSNAGSSAGGSPSGSEDPDILTVYGRLLKDRAARETGTLRDTLLNDAIAAYMRAAELSHATYPLINAATLAFLAGHRDRAEALAAKTIGLLDSGEYAPETDYWLNATRAEALLLLDRIPDAEAALGTAIRCQPEAWEDHASTLRQFSLILQEMGADRTWLAPYRPPPCIHFEGILGIAFDDAATQATIAAQVAAIDPSYAVGALAAGADLLVAEAVIRAGKQLLVVLPCPAELFCETSVKPFGAQWEARFHQLIDQAASVLILDEWHPLSCASIAVAREAAMGLALQESRRLQSSACALRVRSAGETELILDDTPWERLELPVREIKVERSNDVRSALPMDMHVAALLAVPGNAQPKVGEAGLGSPVGKQYDHAIFAFDTLTDGAHAARAIVERHPDLRLGLDYRPVSSADIKDFRGDRAAMIAAATPIGTIALSESAALALALHLPSANVQPMGNIRTPVGDVPMFRLFVDARSDDKIGK